MQIEGKPLPLIDNQKATSFDVWLCDGGVAMTLSDKDGHVSAGAWFTLEQWRDAINHMIKAELSTKK